MGHNDTYTNSVKKLIRTFINLHTLMAQQRNLSNDLAQKQQCIYSFIKKVYSFRMRSDRLEGTELYMPKRFNFYHIF